MPSFSKGASLVKACWSCAGALGRIGHTIGLTHNAIRGYMYCDDAHAHAHVHVDVKCMYMSMYMYEYMTMKMYM